MGMAVHVAEEVFATITSIDERLSRIEEKLSER
jgi:hypothetical protein